MLLQVLAKAFGKDGKHHSGVPVHVSVVSAESAKFLSAQDEGAQGKMVLQKDFRPVTSCLVCVTVLHLYREETCATNTSLPARRCEVLHSPTKTHSSCFLGEQRRVFFVYLRHESQDVYNYRIHCTLLSKVKLYGMQTNLSAG